MARPRRIIKTDNPIGAKINQVMAEQGMEADYAKLADIFGVTTASAREWVHFGRISKARYPTLVEWSGYPLEWWFDLSAETDAPGLNQVNEQPSPSWTAPPPWPFRHITPAQYGRLDSQDRSRVEGFIQGLLAQTDHERHAA